MTKRDDDVQCSYEMIQEYLSRYPHRIEIGRSGVDWNLGASTTYIAIDNVGQEFTVWHVYHDNNPFSKSQPYVKLTMQSYERESLEALRDMLTTILEEDQKTDKIA